MALFRAKKGLRIEPRIEGNKGTIYTIYTKIEPFICAHYTMYIMPKNQGY
jgi:hypothetical protein